MARAPLYCTMFAGGARPPPGSEGFIDRGGTRWPAIQTTLVSSNWGIIRKLEGEERGMRAIACRRHAYELRGSGFSPTPW